MLFLCSNYCENFVSFDQAFYFIHIVILLCGFFRENAANKTNKYLVGCVCVQNYLMMKQIRNLLWEHFFCWYIFLISKKIADDTTRATSI